MTDITTTGTTAKVTVSPEQFTFVDYDAGEIASLVADLTEQLGVANPVRVVVEETTPLSKIRSEIDGTSSDATITVYAESGALENTQRLTTFSAERAREAIGRALLRARDRLRDDFAGVADDRELTLAEHAAWDAYCAGRLAAMGLPVNQQRWRYNYRNRFGFADATDRAFDALWAADGLGWDAVTAPPTA